MAQLAIKGHSTRGKEVIEILEMLGGVNRFELEGDTSLWYVLEDDRVIRHCAILSEGEGFFLEQFLEKFPYKVGDKVITDEGDKANIVAMFWDNDIDDVFYEIQICHEVLKYPKELLQPYKEETMDKVNEALFDANAQCCDIMNKLQNTNNPKLNLGQLNAINFIVRTFADISNHDAINEADITEILDKTATKYLEHIPYGKAKELIRLVTELKDIIKVI